MKKIAILFCGDIYDRKGATNATINRIKHLKSYPQYDITVYCIAAYEYWLIRLLRKTPKYNKVDYVEIDGIHIHMIWQTYSLLDYILSIKLHLRAPFKSLFASTIVNRFKDYDLISAHSDYAGEIASRVNKKYKIPFCITWHGSDIHTLPFSNKHTFSQTKNLLDQARCNFFVSKALLKCANKISTKAKKAILYNGVSENFYKYDGIKRALLRKQFGVDETCKVVAFVGNLFTIKNAQILPEIFEQIQNKSNQALIFWIVGDGKLRPIISHKIKDKSLKCVIWGNQPPSVMPDMMNCIDILILPSKNEGLPLVTVEALKCGATVIGSDVGGIKEAIGDDYVIAIDDDFIDNFSNRVAAALTNNSEPQILPKELDWKKTAELENNYYQEIFSSDN